MTTVHLRPLKRNVTFERVVQLFNVCLRCNQEKTHSGGRFLSFLPLWRRLAAAQPAPLLWVDAGVFGVCDGLLAGRALPCSCAVARPQLRGLNGLPCWENEAVCCGCSALLGKLKLLGCCSFCFYFFLLSLAHN